MEKKMSGIFLVDLEDMEYKRKIQEHMAALGITDVQEYQIEQYHDKGDRGEHTYHVFKISGKKKEYILKKSSAEEVMVYKEMLENHSFSVPSIYHTLQDKNGKYWILMEYIPGADLRECNESMAICAAKSIGEIHNYYWKEKTEDKSDGRFQKYWKIISKRENCLIEESEILRAYQVFLERQKLCPRTLCNGNYLPCNVIYNQNRLTVVDWAFGGMMPYSLDLARIITHGNEKRFPFPYYMTDDLRKTFITAYYGEMKNKPDYKQYLWDITLSALNECVEFIEQELADKSLERDDGFDHYYQTAIKIANIINRSYDSFHPSGSIDKKDFTNALLRFVEEAQAQKNVVTAEKVEQYFKALGVDKGKLESVYSYLTAAGIRVEGTVIKFPESEPAEKISREKSKKGSFFEMYLEDLSAIPEYGQEEEEALIASVMEGDKTAREHLIEGNLKYVLHLAEVRSKESDAFYDLIQEGNMGLIQAVSELEKRKKGQLFRDFAKTYVEDAITGYLEDQVGSERIKRHLVEEINRLDEAVRMLHEELGREATAKELADYLDMEEEDIVHLIKMSHNAVKAKDH